ncbi:hypothetical protein FIBSPDRAFT_901609 [Athelia psychrophila]|uniref:Uncharacterized protein n=1 Tax=Athelia psychrophila TaxID=1759441 RepID=A0A165WYN5_9AGAM|nr:hypothetical protein FIBSPDRAFT_901609 [Fibularhizoctonia sp. CBS 109695]
MFLLFYALPSPPHSFSFTRARCGGTAGKKFSGSGRGDRGEAQPQARGSAPGAASARAAAAPPHALEHAHAPRPARPRTRPQPHAHQALEHDDDRDVRVLRVGETDERRARGRGAAPAVRAQGEGEGRGAAPAAAGAAAAAHAQLAGARGVYAGKARARGGPHAGRLRPARARRLRELLRREHAGVAGRDALLVLLGRVRRRAPEPLAPRAHKPLLQLLDAHAVQSVHNSPIPYITHHNTPPLPYPTLPYPTLPYPTLPYLYLRVDGLARVLQGSAPPVARVHEAALEDAHAAAAAPPAPRPRPPLPPPLQRLLLLDAQLHAPPHDVGDVRHELRRVREEPLAPRLGRAELLVAHGRHLESATSMCTGQLNCGIQISLRHTEKGETQHIGKWSTRLRKATSIHNQKDHTAPEPENHLMQELNGAICECVGWREIASRGRPWELDLVPKSLLWSFYIALKHYYYKYLWWRYTSQEQSEIELIVNNDARAGFVVAVDSWDEHLGPGGVHIGKGGDGGVMGLGVESMRDLNQYLKSKLILLGNCGGGSARALGGGRLVSKLLLALHLPRWL